MRNRRSIRWNRKSAVLVLLLGVSVCALFVPTRYTAWLMNLVQVLMPFQAAANRAADAAERAIVGPPAATVSQEEYEHALRERRRMEMLAHSLAQRIQALEARNRELTGIRDLGLDTRGQLIPARVISQDLLNWRESRLVDKGTLRGVRPGSAVVSNYFTVNAGLEEGVTDGLRVMSSEALIGTVVQAATHSSRVQLLTDPDTRMIVTVSRRREDRLLPLNREFWLTGVGKGGMEIRDVGHGYIEQGDVQVGDVVMTVGEEPTLPVPVAIGIIREIRRDPDNGLLHILDVEPSVRPEDLSRVYVVNAGRAD